MTTLPSDTPSPLKRQHRFGGICKIPRLVQPEWDHATGIKETGWSIRKDARAMSFDLCFLFILYLHLFSLMVVTPVWTEPFVISRGVQERLRTSCIWYRHLFQITVHSHIKRRSYLKIISHYFLIKGHIKHFYL